MDNKEYYMFREYGQILIVCIIIHLVHFQFVFNFINRSIIYSDRAILEYAEEIW
jgi:hypothetical protein